MYTIGDCYIVIGFKDAENIIRDPSKEILNTLRFAFGMKNTIEKINEIHQIGIGMRIGLHIGDIITGVTGTNIVRFDFYGPNVKVANKMESEGIKGKINISQKVKDYLD